MQRRRVEMTLVFLQLFRLIILPSPTRNFAIPKSENFGDPFLPALGDKNTR